MWIVFIVSDSADWIEEDFTLYVLPAANTHIFAMYGLGSVYMPISLIDLAFEQ